MIKAIIKYALLLVLAVSLAMAVAWGHAKAGNQTCTSLSVEIANRDTTSFVTELGVRAELDRLGIHPIGMRYNDIDATRIETVLRRSEYLENVECVKAPNGRLIVRASQLVPVMRVFDGDRSFYVNSGGKRMAATANYHIDVPVVQGHFTDDFPPTRLLPLLQYVESDDLLSNLVTMICVQDPDNIFIVPAIYGHVVNLGPPDNVKAKFEKLKLFYRKVMPYKGWNTYDTLSVKWEHQVVATRRDKIHHKTDDAFSWSTDEQDPDLEAIGDTDSSLTDSLAKSQNP